MVSKSTPTTFLHFTQSGGRFLLHWKKCPAAAFPSPCPWAGGGPRGASSLPKASDWTREEGRGESLGLSGVWGGVVGSLGQEQSPNLGRAAATRDYLLGALCPMPSVRDFCECWILFVPLMLISKAHTVLLITGLKNVSCCRVITFYKFKSAAVI